MATDAIEAARLEELRFAKRQQWAVAIATITFIAGAFHMAHSVKPLLEPWEKLTATILVSIVAIGASVLISKLQCHLYRTRKNIDPNDKSLRGLDVAIGLVLVLVISAIAVCYSMWRD
jgi:hypothetical protein